MKKLIWIAYAAVLIGCVLRAAAQSPATPTTARPLTQDAYIWQRAWTRPVQESIARHATNFSELVVLSAEITWSKAEPRATRVSLDYPLLRNTGRPIGLALRVGSFPGPFSPNDKTAKYLRDFAKSILADAKTNNVPVAELQIDFDCAESKLDGYRTWLEAIRDAIAPTPLVFTALPSWLNEPNFKKLAKGSDGFVLQVHSLARPKGIDTPFQLCDPQAARKSVSQAAECGVPFRVALPTYGYQMAFDASGHFIGLSAEGPAASWPDGCQLREVRADAPALAALVSGWKENRPALLCGVIWYRLPVPGETLNWRWQTLNAVMQGKPPTPDLRATARSPKPGLVEIHLRNAGTLDPLSPARIIVRWKETRLVACDGLNHFSVSNSQPNSVEFVSDNPHIGPDEKKIIGWVRWDSPTEVTLDTK